MALTLLGILMLLIGTAIVRRCYTKDSARPTRWPDEKLERELDRLENVLRRDPHRDDMWQMYEERLERTGAEGRARRESFLAECGKR